MVARCVERQQTDAAASRCTCGALYTPRYLPTYARLSVACATCDLRAEAARAR